MGADYIFTHRSTNYSRVDYILGDKVQSFEINPEHAVIEDSHYQSTSTTVSWKQDQ
jgi:hypothetical protein